MSVTAPTTDVPPKSGEVTNWFGNQRWTPAVSVWANSVEDVVRVVKDPVRYPSPVRAVGSNHSVTRCAAAGGGTTLFMGNMNRILEIRRDPATGTFTVTTEPGASYIDVAQELARHDLQFYVNIELGNLSMGAAACVGTKEGAFVGEPGQVSSCLVGAKIVTAAGDLLEIREDRDPELIQAFRSSYGTFGVVTEVTFKVRPLQAMTVYHETYSLEDFLAALPSLEERGQSLMLYLDPFNDLVTVEFRDYHDRAGEPFTHWQWRLRNFLWKDAEPFLAHEISTRLPSGFVQSACLNLIGHAAHFLLRTFIRGKTTMAPDQQIRYPDRSGEAKYTFSIWTYPESDYPQILRDYFAFCKDYHKKTGFRTNLMNVGYRTFKDQAALLSYTYDHDSITCDPVCTGTPGWNAFLAAYNEFAVKHHGVPLLNQTAQVQEYELEAAFGARAAKLSTIRARLDPGGRFLNDFFRRVLPSPAAESTPGAEPTPAAPAAA